ncbi:MAG: hypothetical protein RLZZ470_556, partial [Pseudomonadota bacterium]
QAQFRLSDTEVQTMMDQAAMAKGDKP